ncbi:MAG TPA: phosphatidylserine decarboxylase [Cyanobacteria bacterium UBA8530]|nr:phosphatidylserine decarboxylase [Cyanobacteria bacterium UBA8530]
MSTLIEFWDREKEMLRSEPAYAGDFVRWCYQTAVGRFFLEHFFAKRPFNWLYGHFQASRWSLPEIERDIESFHIDLTEYEESTYRSYAEFFHRSFRPGARTFQTDPEILPAFAEGKYLAFAEMHPEREFPVKGRCLKPGQLLGNAELAKEFEGGPMLICRLCPIDYHHFHYPDDGESGRSYRVGGGYHSVNILALKAQPDIFLKNEREITLLSTRNFGPLAFIEVGAMTVGKIVQTHPNPAHFKRGEEKGYFMFGASTVIVLGKKGCWRPAVDLLEQTAAGRETHVKLGTGVASRE